MLSALALSPLCATLAQAEPITLRISDLQPGQTQELDRRLDYVTERMCEEYSSPLNTPAMKACATAVRAEAMDKIRKVEQQAARSVSVASR